MDREDFFRPEPTGLGDCVVVARLIEDALTGIDEAYDSMASNSWRRWWTRRVYLPFYLHFLNDGWKVSRGRILAGYLYLQFGRVSCQINAVGVVPGFRRRGLARGLMQFAEERARQYQRALQAMTLAVSLRNTAAVTLYTSLGYRCAPYHYWSGTPDLFQPLSPEPLTVRELSPERRPPAFLAFWARSLEALDLPVAALLSDQARYWWSPGGRAFELWGDEAEPLGYADLVVREGTAYLRILPLRPDDSALVAALLAGAAQAVREETELRRGGLRMEVELGSEVADDRAGALMRSLGFGYRLHPRVLMVKELGPVPIQTV